MNSINPWFYPLIAVAGGAGGALGAWLFGEPIWMVVTTGVGITALVLTRLIWKRYA